MISEVRWEGLAQMAADLRSGWPTRMGRGCSELTKGVMGTVHELYVENLSGGAPSTASRPLPVGMRSGDLRDGAKKVQVNQYRGDVFNEVPYAGFIESGTQHMAPRRPLGDAVDRAQEMLPGQVGQVMTTIIITEGA